jgi:hypothetical protein
VKISRHLHYIQNPDSCFRYELIFDPPIDVESTLGKIDPLYPDMESSTENSPKRLEKTANVINKNGLLHISEVMKPGETLSIDLRSGFRLDKLVIADENELQVLVRNKGLTYKFSIGKKGVFQVTGKVIKDDDGLYRDLKADLTDVSMREYVVMKSLSNSVGTTATVEATPDILNTKKAAKYLGRSESWLYKKAGSGEIHRTSHKMFRKSDLDAFKRMNERRRR